MNPFILFFSFVGFLISSLVTFILIPWIIKICNDSNMLITTDAHKKHKPLIAEPGGIAPLLAFTFSLLIVIFLATLTNDFLGTDLLQSDSQILLLIMGLLSVVIAGLIGIIDDIFAIKWRYKIILGFLPPLPLMIFRIGKSTVNIPIIGVIDFGTILYTLIIVPLAVNFAFNSYNMLAGYNGMEAGNGVISAITILIFSYVVGNEEVLLFISCLLGGLVILLWFNKYPAKILMGDTGTLFIGTALVVPLILGNMERLALGIFFLYFINFLLFFVYSATKQKQKLASIDEEEYLVPPCPWTVYWIFPYYKKLKEYQNVAIIWTLQALFSFSILLIAIGSI